MTKSFIIIFTCFFSIAVYGQREKTIADFRIDFKKALNKDFSSKQFYKIYDDYVMLLSPHGAAGQIAGMRREWILSMYPLYEFKKEKLYTDNINSLVNSANASQRLFAYVLIGSSFDTSKENLLLDKMATDKEKDNSGWAGMALLNLDCNHTTELFDFLVKDEDFGDAHMIPFYIRLNKDSLQQTAYNRINNKDERSKILAAQILSVTSLNTKTEEVLKEAVQNWDMNIKGYAIYSVKELEMGNLLEIFKPLLNDKKTRAISLQALANSPTKADKDFLYGLVEQQQDTLPKELLDALVTSKNIDNVKYWLRLLYTRTLPKEYDFFTFEQPLISSDLILPELQTALQKITDKTLLGELVRALEKRDDDKTVAIIRSLLQHKNSTVRYWTAKTVEDNPSKKFKEPGINKLIKKGLADGNTPDD